MSDERDLSKTPPCPNCGEIRKHECQMPLPPVYIDVSVGKKP